MYKNLILPASLLAGTIIGAGIFAMPYTFEKAGTLTGLFYLIIFAGILTLVHLMYADVILKTEGFHRFVGYAEIYLGKIGKWLTVLMTVVGMIFTLVIYLVLSISFINLIVPEISNFYKVLAFWFLGSFGFFLKINHLAFSEFLIITSIIAVILIIFGYGFGNLAPTISSLPSFNPSYLFLPYGVVLFSLSGRVAIPSVINFFRKNNQPLIRAKIPIILGTFIPVVVYFLFVLAILSLSKDVSQDAISGLISNLPSWVLKLLGVFGIISLWSTYIVISRDVGKSLEYDFRFPKMAAGLLIIFAPFLLYLAGFQSFLKLVSFVGGVFIGLEGILVALMWFKSTRPKAERIIFKKLNPLIVYILIFIFIGGIIYELIY